MDNKRIIACEILDSFTDEQIDAFITLFASENIKARIEADRIANDPSKKHYKNFNEIERELKP